MIGRIADAELARFRCLLHPGACGLSDLLLAQARFAEWRMSAIGDDRFESDCIERCARPADRRKPLRNSPPILRSPPPLREWLRYGPLQRQDGPPMLRFLRSYGSRSERWPVSTIRHARPEASMSRRLTSAAPSWQATLDIGFARCMRFQIEQGRAKGADGKPERLLEFVGPRWGWAIAFGEQRLELLPIEIGRRYAMTMMVDQRNARDAFNRHRDTACTWPPVPSRRTSRSPCV